MAAIMERYNIAIDEVLLNPKQSSHFAHGFQLASQAQSHSESQSPELTSTWEKHESTKTTDTDEDRELHQLMEDIKRYIRSIDIGNL
jgi:hypothetical protein